MGKVYGAMLMYEHWKAYKSRKEGKSANAMPVRPNILQTMSVPGAGSLGSLAPAVHSQVSQNTHKDTYGRDGINKVGWIYLSMCM